MNNKMVTLSLLSLQKRLQNYYLPIEIAESIPLYSNFIVDETLHSCKLIAPSEFQENCYTVQQLLRIENVNVYHSLVLTDNQYSLIESFHVTQKNEGSLIFVIMYYVIFLILSYGIVSSKCKI